MSRNILNAGIWKDESKIIIVLWLQEGTVGGLRATEVDAVLLHQNNNSQSFSWLWQKPLWLQGTVWQQVFLQSLFKSTHVQAAHTLRTGSWNKKGIWFVWSICCSWWVCLHTHPPLPIHICDREYNYGPVATFLIPHTLPITNVTFPAFHKERSITYPAAPSHRREAECKLTPPRAGLHREPEKWLGAVWWWGSRDMSASDCRLWKVSSPVTINVFQGELSNYLPTEGAKKAAKE